jgi:cell division protease FtsH
MSRPKTDKYQQTRTEIKDEIAMSLGGRAAEQLVFNELTAGAASDIERATMLARRMVVDFGMSDLGPVAMGQMTEMNNWGYSYGESVRLSEDTQAKVDAEIKKLVDEGLKTAERVLEANKKVLDKIVTRLMKIETLEQEEFEKIVGKPKAVFVIKK